MKKHLTMFCILCFCILSSYSFSQERKESMGFLTYTKNLNTDLVVFDKANPFHEYQSLSFANPINNSTLIPFPGNMQNTPRKITWGKKIAIIAICVGLDGLIYYDPKSPGPSFTAGAVLGFVSGLCCVIFI